MARGGTDSKSDRSGRSHDRRNVDADGRRTRYRSDIGQHRNRYFTRGDGGTLLDRLSLLGAKLLDQNLSALIAGTLKTVPQNGEQACQASKLTKKESPINWQTPAIQIERKIRAFNPWPTATATLNGIRLRVHRAKTIMNDSPACPGEIVKANRAGLTVQTGQGLLSLQILQKAGGRPMSVETILNGMDISEGMAFDLDG